jgi:hypothetical protein
MTRPLNRLARPRLRFLMAAAALCAALGLIIGGGPVAPARSQAARTPTGRPPTQRAATPSPTPTRALDRTPEPSNIERQQPPSPICAVSQGALTCYQLSLRLNANGSPRGWVANAATRISKADEAVLDFVQAPDGSWVAYRVDNVLTLSPTAGEDAQTQAVAIDTDAAPPAALSDQAQSIAWAPDGIALAYITALGIKTAYPGALFATDFSRPFVSVKWSRNGAYLAAQSADGGWLFFQSAPGKLTLKRIFAEPAEAAWLDDRAVVLAPTVGGLLRLDASASSDTPPDWYIADEYFIKLRSGAPGEVVALHPDGGGAIGSAVSIRADGQWTALGRAKLDSRLDWGPEPGNILYYITSGTPILVDRATGDENLLPMRTVARVGFNIQLPERLGVTLDADLYFLASDSRGVSQLWRLPRDGAPLIQLSRSTTAVSGYDVSGERVQYTTNGVTITVTRDGTIPEVATPDTTGPGGFSVATATPLSTATSIPVTLQRVGWQPGPSTFRRVAPDGTTSAPFLFENPMPSPSGRYVAGSRGPNGARLVVLDWSSGALIAIQGIYGPTVLRWVQ